MMRPVKKAVFPVGGMGTRFLPATKALPKEMLPIVDKPLIQYAVEEARDAGIEEFIFVTGRGKSAIEDHFDFSHELNALLVENHKLDELESIAALLPPAGAISYTRQQEPLGLGHAVWCARHLVADEPFAVMLPDELFLSDTPCLKQLMDVYDDKGGCVFGLGEVSPEQTTRYGIVDPAEDDGRLVRIKGMVEKPKPADAPSNLSIIGRYILQPGVFNYLGRQKRTVGGEIQLTDSMAELLGQEPFHGIRYEGRRFDCGSKGGFLKANIASGLERAELRDELREFLKDPDRAS
ncbi:MAG: UTP--glucose-1-phosphate uridylyltransferase GalU [Alphaproteobacteria bacterium]|jgi:UTP--glucose-1-phosphate uridylyltransferase|nr:UTP--glucose-1-phosphate uridylyltransferase GalU [Alphaproteobacteria bacterium]